MTLTEQSPLIVRRRHSPRGEYVPLELPTSSAPLSARQLALWSHAINPFKSHAFIVTFLLVLLIVFGTGQKVFFRLMLFPMANYVLLINQVQALSFIPLFFFFAQFNKHFKHKGQWPHEVTKISLWSSAGIGALEMLNMLLQLFGGAHLGGAVQVLLSQTRIPLTMLLSYFLLDTTYTLRQYLGVAIVLSGIVVAVGFDTHQEKSGHSFWWSFVFMSAALPSCLANVWREQVLNRRMDPFVLGYRIAMFQFFLGIPLLLVFAPLSNLPLSELPENFRDGLRCWILGETPASATTAAQDCAGAPFAVWAFLLSNFGYNVIQLLVFKYASATIQIIATTLIIPLSGLAFSSPLIMGQHAKPWKIREVIGAVLVGSGILIYKSVIRVGVQTLKFSFGMNSSEVGLPVHGVHSPNDPRHKAVHQFLAVEHPESLSPDDSDDELP